MNFSISCFLLPGSNNILSPNFLEKLYLSTKGLPKYSTCNPDFFSILSYTEDINKIYSSNDYKNDWSPKVSDGTYFYIVNVSDGRKFNGFFQVFSN